jgi:hypothetical protein
LRMKNSDFMKTAKMLKSNAGGIGVL